MDIQHNDAYNAGRLIQWGLKPKARPVQEQEYKKLIDIYHDRADFRAMLRSFAQGLGLVILSIDEHGLILGPENDSPFAMSPADFMSRTAARITDERLRDGLIMVAIAATIFPKASDLEENAAIARPPVTVKDVDETLQRFCTQFEEQARGNPDPSLSDEEEGLVEAWRVYRKLLTAMETSDGRKANRTTGRYIELIFDRLSEFGCFTSQTQEKNIYYQSTYKYQVLVKELAATYAFEKVRQFSEGQL